MLKQHYKIDIKASADKVFKAMLGIDDIKTYEEWTTEFNPTSSYEGNWEKGSKIYFISTDENQKKSGMVAEVAEHIPNQFVSIRHYGVLNGNVEITEGEEVESWAGGFENYFFEEDNGVTTVTVDVDVMEDHLDYFNKTFPKALKKLKALCEK